MLISHSGIILTIDEHIASQLCIFATLQCLQTISHTKAINSRGSIYSVLSRTPIMPFGLQNVEKSMPGCGSYRR
jgi:hypothetical protein